MNNRNLSYLTISTNHGDRLYDQQLMRDLQIINARTTAEQGPLPAGGIPSPVKRKPNVSYSKLISGVGTEYSKAGSQPEVKDAGASLQENDGEEKIVNPEKLKIAAENLEWVLNQYPDSRPAQEMLTGLKPLIDTAKAKAITKPLKKTPFSYEFSDGVYASYKEPSINDAYAIFAIEIEGGLTESEKRIIAEIEAYKASRRSPHE